MAQVFYTPAPAGYEAQMADAIKEGTNALVGPNVPGGLFSDEPVDIAAYPAGLVVNYKITVEEVRG